MSPFQYALSFVKNNSNASGIDSLSALIDANDARIVAASPVNG